MDWHLIISLATLVLVIFTIVWGTGLWTNREKIKITYPRMLVRLETDKATGIHFECQFRLTYVKGTREQYVRKKLLCKALLPLSLIGEGDTGGEVEIPCPTGKNLCSVV